ncbi:MAG: hypothetical protein DSY80_05710 [Desulfocapsa sp.]|nr:MAG: hypothetical protein DSY80_05710 [Desulfocapsa sp.]
MATDSQAALAKLAADTKSVCATSSDITKAVAHSSSAKPAATVATKNLAFHAKAAVITHSFFLIAVGGIILGAAAYHLVNKYRLNKEKAAEQIPAE